MARVKDRVKNNHFLQILMCLNNALKKKREWLLIHFMV